MNNSNFITNLYQKVSNSFRILNKDNVSFLNYLDEASKYFKEIGVCDVIVYSLDNNKKEELVLNELNMPLLIVWAKRLLISNVEIIDDENNELYHQIIEEISKSLVYIYNKLGVDVNKDNIKRIG